MHRPGTKFKLSEMDQSPVIDNDDRNAIRFEHHSRYTEKFMLEQMK